MRETHYTLTTQDASEHSFSEPSVLPRRANSNNSPRMNRCIVREQDPTFEASFIESCLLVVGKISGVWGNFGEMSHASRAPTGAGSGNTGAGEKECATQQPAPRGSDILDMLLGLGSRATCTRVSAREAFRSVWLRQADCRV